jgi:four helix bundle protein
MNSEVKITNGAQSFKDLVVWQKAHDFVLAVYKHTAAFPKEEVYGLTSQFRRAAVSCPANISEGFPKKGKADKLRFFNISQGSLEEFRYYCLLAKELHYIDEEAYLILEAKAQDVSKILRGYMQKISNSM